MKKTPITLSFTLNCLLLAIVVLNGACNKIKPGTPAITILAQASEDRLLYDIDVKKQLVVWKHPDSSSASFKRWMKNFIDTAQKKGGVQQMFCGCCDSTLRLLWGTGVATYIQTNTVSGGQKATASTTATGEDGPAYVSINFKVNRPRKLPNFGSYFYKSSAFNGSPVTVAVFDTGLDTIGLKNYLYKPTSTTCIPGAAYGWNFVADTKNYNDDNLELHGTSVTRYITDQVLTYKKRSIQVLPVKTNNANGVGDLYSMLCGFAYAKERGAKIINTSIGFPEPRLENIYKDLNNVAIDPNVQLLKQFVLHYLTSNNILLVAAAGNYDPLAVKAAFDLTGFNTYTDTKLPYPTNYRSLDQFSFYPASLSRDTTRFWNVIAVSTVDTAASPSKVSPNQNFSPNVVDLGVKADAILNSDHYVFNNPNLSAPPTATLEGSSFATPIVTGKLCANYTSVSNIIRSASGFRKYQLLEVISPPSSGFSNNLTNKIRNGRFVDK